MYQLKRRDIAPPGGFVAKAPTGCRFKFDTFSEAEERLSKHLEANGYNPGDAEGIIERDTVKQLMQSSESRKWLEIK